MITLLMGIPLCVFNVGFNAMFASAVPVEWRASVVGGRSVVQSLVFIIASFASGYILNHMAFPLGYQLIFGFGFFSAVMSTYHLFFIHPYKDAMNLVAIKLPRISGDEQENHRVGAFASLRLDIFQTPYWKILLVLFGFHFSQYIVFPLFAFFNVNHLHLSDANIGLGTALFYLTVLLGSTQLGRLENKFGHHHLTGWGVAGMGFYPIALAFSHNAQHYYLVSIIGGFAFALAAGAYGNYLLERIPENDRPAHLAWYNIILNSAVLIGSLAGPFIAGFIGVLPALIIFGILRLLAGLAILYWGN
jgi:MFS family permease